MKNTTARSSILSSFLVCLAMVLPARLHAQSYNITDLASNSWSYSEAHALNGVGLVAGEFASTNFFNVLAFLYENGAITELGHLTGAPYAVAYGINDISKVVGESDTANTTHAFLYSNGTMTDLGTLGANNTSGYSSAHAINRAEQVVGESSVSFSQVGTIHAVLYSGNSKTDLGALGGDYSNANAINNSNVIVGETDVVLAGVTNVHAFVYSSGSMSDLGTLGGGYSSAKGVNDSGTIVGESEAVTGGATNLHAFAYRNGAMSDLGAFGGSASSASAINSAGQIVGYATDTNEVSNAFLYNGAMVNLNDFIPPGSGWTNLSSADAINDQGQIAGSGFLADGSFHGYLLTLASGLSVTITNPPPNATFQAPATVAIGASVSDLGGAITNVQFLVNGSVIANTASTPYSATANNLGAGSYTLTAVALDNAGLAATNNIAITVTNGSLTQITILDPSFSGTSFRFSFNTQSGFTYDAQSATPLAPTNSWFTFTNVAGNGSSVQVTDPSATNAQKFYRVLAH
jgi:probable HAF family extracellular repeat protein